MKSFLFGIFLQPGLFTQNYDSQSTAAEQNKNSSLKVQLTTLLILHCKCKNIIIRETN